MVEFTTHNIESAPEGSKPLLEKSQKAYGMIPNLHGIMAESPQLLEAYQTTGALLTKSSLEPHEQHVLWLTVSIANSCHYCVPAHSFAASKAGVPDEVIQALRNKQAIEDHPKLEALRQFLIQMIEKRGELDQAQVQAFLDAGFTKQSICDVILGIGQKTMSNYLNHLSQTEVDERFAPYK